MRYVIKLFTVVILIHITTMLLPAQDMAIATVRYKRTEPVSGKRLDQMIETLERQQGRKLTMEEKKNILESLIDQMLIHQAAEAERRITVTSEEVEQAGLRLISQQLTSIGALPPGAVLTDKNQYEQIIKQQGLTLEEFESTVQKQLMAEKYVSFHGREEFQNIEPASDEDISAEYQKRVQEFVVSDSVWFNQIFFDTRSLSPAEINEKQIKADDVHRQLLNTSATFIDLVVAESEDEVSRARGGKIGPLMKGDEVAKQLYGSEFIKSVFKMNVEDISGVLKSKVGFHIIQITEKKAAQLLPKDSTEVKTYLQQLIFAERYQKKFDEIAEGILEEIRAKSTINYFGEYK